MRNILAYIYVSHFLSTSRTRSASYVDVNSESEAQPIHIWQHGQPKGKKNRVGQFIPRAPARGTVTIWHTKIFEAFEYEKGRVFANYAKRILCVKRHVRRAKLSRAQTL